MPRMYKNSVRCDVAANDILLAMLSTDKVFLAAFAVYIRIYSIAHTARNV